jgi:PAS domain S-box-containing protein
MARNTREITGFIADDFELLPDPFVVLYPDGRIMDCNRAFLDFSGFSREEIDASSPRVLCITPAESHPRKISAAGRDVDMPFSYTAEIPRRDGTFVPMGLFMNEIRDGWGDLYFSYGILLPAQAKK